MKPRFHKHQDRARWRELDAVERARAALCHAFLGGAGAHPDIDALLARTARYTIRRGRGICGFWWQVGDAGLLFDHRAGVVGEARGGDFAARDRTLWTGLAEAVMRPRRIDWSVDGAKPLWKATRTAALVRAIGERGGEPRPVRKRSPSYTAGDAVDILYAGEWYAGVINAKVAAGYRVAYVGWDASWNETVKGDRLRPRAVVAKVTYAVGDPVDIAYGDVWYPGTITSVHPRERYGITYTGWASSWDERVPGYRLRPPSARARK